MDIPKHEFPEKSNISSNEELDFKLCCVGSLQILTVPGLLISICLGYIDFVIMLALLDT